MRLPSRSIRLFSLLLFVFATSEAVEPAAAGPGDRIRGGGGLGNRIGGKGLRRPGGGSGSGEQRQRAPYDDVEGTIWEYKADPEKPPTDGEPVKKLEGRIRLEGNAIFDARKRLKRSGEDTLRDKLSRFRSGETDELSVPSGPEEERIGEYKKLSSGKVRLDLDDEQTLHGTMLIWPKPDAADGVWLGQYTETNPEDDKTVEKWVVELRKIQD